MISQVISVCTRRDLNVWIHCAPYVLRYIEAKTYLIIVPDIDVELFCKMAPLGYQVHSESQYTRKFSQLLKSKIDLTHPDRYGWYLQQLIKISAASTVPKGSTSIIWDADTAPLKPLNFEDNQGRLLFRKGTEMHKPYFENLFHLTGIVDHPGYSFISQCLPFKQEWIAEFIENIESIKNTSWPVAIIESIDFSEVSGFSEYETLGNFFLSKHSDKMKILESSWSRYGNEIIGGVDNLKFITASLLRINFEFIAFESWDSNKKKSKLNLFKRFIRIFLYAK